MLIDLILLVAGISILIYSADLLVEVTSSVATKSGVSLVVVAAVVVGFGTSMPEMAVSFMAAARNDLDLGIGNVLGSVIANLSLVLGFAALFGKVPISQRALRTYFPLSLNAVFWFYLFIQGGLRRYEGFFLLFILIISLVLIVKIEKKDAGSLDEDSIKEPPINEEHAIAKGKISMQDAIRSITSLLGILLSSYVITEGSIGLAEAWGVGSGYIGATLVAAGTSLPELVASVVAVRKGKPEIIIGTILGSNVFNGAAIGAGMGIIGPGKVGDSTLIGWITFFALLAIVLVWIGKGLAKKPLGRIAGTLLIVIYGLWLLLVWL